MGRESGSDEVREAVRQHYAAFAQGFGRQGGCCGPDARRGESGGGAEPLVVYRPEDLSEVHLEQSPSLGCGNPIAQAELAPGEVVLDLGCGAGLDVLLAARRVGPEGTVYGLDMTDEMLSLAQEHKRRAGARNAHFLRGRIAAIPLPDQAVDVVLSNCVINLSTDKEQVLREALRVLRPGGRFCVADMVEMEPMPEDLRRSLSLWAGCIAGALPQERYREILRRAGFEHISFEELAVFRGSDVGLADRPGSIASMLITATRPAA